LNCNQPSRAIELLCAAVPYEAGIPYKGGSEFLPGVGNFYPAYVRGVAYLMAHQCPESVIEFKKIVDHLGIVLSDPSAALVNLQLARAYGLAGEKQKSRAGYEHFLSLRKDADSSIPVLNPAKAECAKLAKEGRRF